MKMHRSATVKKVCLVRLRGGIWPPDPPPHYYEEAHLSPEDRKRHREMVAEEKRRQDAQTKYENAPVPYKVIHSMFQNFNRTMNAWFDQTNARFDQTNARFDQINVRFDANDARFDNQDVQINAIRTEVTKNISAFWQVFITVVVGPVVVFLLQIQAKKLELF